LELTSDDKIRFSKHRGHLLSDVYKFAPTYLNWSIKYSPEFTIDIKKFNELPQPTPYIKPLQTNINGQIFNIGMNSHESDIDAASELIKTGKIIKEENFVFPEQIVIIND